jgi:iron uptake system component EfeO
LNHARLASLAALSAATLAFGACGGDEAEITSQSASYSTTTTSEATATGDAAIDGAVGQYDAYVEENASSLVEATDTFVAAIDAGDLKQAKELYPRARAYFERIEPVAGAFGSLDPEIDAREGDVPKDGWTGFHPIEKALWIDESTAGLEDLTAELERDAEKLERVAEDGSFGAAEIAQGSVDLLGEVSASKITGEEERYSHTDLWDFEANVEGAEAGFRALEPVIEETDPGLATEIAGDFSASYALLDEYRAGADGFVLYDTLTEDDTRRLAQQIDVLGEALSQIPALIG